MWNVIAPKGSDHAIAATARQILAEHPDMPVGALSQAIADRVKGARVGPLVTNNPIANSDARTIVTLWFTGQRLALLETLRDASPVFETIGDVVMGVLGPGLEMAEDDLRSDAEEALRYIGGLTPERRGELDELDRRARGQDGRSK